MTPDRHERNRPLVPIIFDLLRHGAAESAGATGDDSRRLTPRGEAVVRELGRRLAAEDWRPDHAYSSPLVRARQTLEIVLDAAGIDRAPEVLEELDPDEGAAGLLEALATRGASGHVLLVGHQPMMGDLCARLSGRSQRFEPGSLVRIELTGGRIEPVARGALVRAIHPAAPRNRR